MSHSGSCMCGAVSYKVSAPLSSTNACHCAMCRKWSGGVFFGTVVPKDGLEFEGADNLKIYTSSPWAERAFCATCGSSVFYRVTAEGPMQGEYHIAVGTLDDASGIAFDSEFFIDLKPSIYSFSGTDRQQYTQAQVEEMFSGVE